MKLHFLLIGTLALVLQISAPDSMAHGGGGGGGHGGGGHGGGGGMYHGGGHYGGGFHGHGRHFARGRFFGPGIGFYGYGYPWWGYGYGYGYPYYSSYYGYDNAYYDNGYYGDQYGANPRYLPPRAIQTALAWRGYYNGRIDGVMGPETRSAIRSFQAQRGLPATGQIDSRLVNALRR
jgi:hypothetical protein